MGHLDRTDLDILRHLQNDATASFKVVAHAVGLAPSTVYERVRRLRQTGALRGAHADVDPEVFGVRLEAMVTVRLAVHSTETFTDFADYLRDIPEVLCFYSVAGQQDFLVHVGVRDSAHLQELTTVRLASRREVAHLETSLIFEHHSTPVLPDLSGDE